MRNLITSSGATIVCLQETKIENWNQQLLNESVGQDLASSCAILPAVGTAGGILLAASERFFKLTPTQVTAHSVSAKITMLEENVSWCITGVYVPHRPREDRIHARNIGPQATYDGPVANAWRFQFNLSSGRQEQQQN